MRFRLAIILLGLLAAAAACGGGGKSGVVPSLGGNSGGGNQSSSANGKASMVLYVPPPSRQAARKPLYISPGTQSFGVLAVSATSTATPNVINEQIFPVATPSPCAAASAGGYTCTLNVTAPVGLDVFYVGAYSTQSPGPNAIPISEWIATGVNVSLSPSPGATPLSFTLNGVVYDVAVTVASPDPGNTPNTQVFPAGVASETYALGIAAYDSSGNQILLDPTTPFANPITIEASPANGGVGLETAGPSQCSSAPTASSRRRAQSFPTGSASTVTIACAADLTNVEYGYDGTTTPDPNDHVVDAFTIAAATNIASPAPSPANVRLESNIIQYQIPTAGSYVQNAFLQELSSGQLLYVAYTDGSALIGTFAPSTGTVGAPATLTVASQDDVSPRAVAVTSGGAVWVLDEYNYPPTLDCWTSTAGGTAAQSGIELYDPTGEDQLYPTAITVDGANNLWYVGYDTETGQQYAGYFPEASACASPSSSDAAYTLNGDIYDDSAFVAPLTNGIVFNSGSGSANAGIYTVTTTGSASVSPVAAALGSTSYSGGVGLGADGSTYAAFSMYESGSADLEKMPSGGGTLTTLLDLVPTSSIGDDTADPYGLSVFSLNGVGDRVNYVDGDFAALGLIGNLQTTPTTMLDALPNSFDAYQSAHSSKGGEFVIYEDESDNLYIARAYQTTTWNVPATVVGGGECGTTGLLSINQRAPSSGPFTISLPDGGGATPLPGSNNDFLLSPAESQPFTVTVTDAGGRTETYSLTVNEGEGC